MDFWEPPTYENTYPNGLFVLIAAQIKSVRCLSGSIFQYSPLPLESFSLLGICLGMQLFGLKSDEGSLPGLSWLELESKKFNPPDPRLFPVPHLGWEYVSIKNNGSKLLKGFDDETKFYFAHSYYVNCKNREEVILEANYIHSFDASVQKNHIAGVQFHPEKSHSWGIDLLSNFARQ